jgi:hypothetical protein
MPWSPKDTMTGARRPGRAGKEAHCGARLGAPRTRDRPWRTKPAIDDHDEDETSEGPLAPAWRNEELPGWRHGPSRDRSDKRAHHRVALTAGKASSMEPSGHLAAQGRELALRAC